jgi:hypothetical protein
MRPILQTQSAKLKTCTLTVISTFFGLGGLCKAMLPTLGLSLRMLSPTCVQTCPSCTMLDPSWGQVGPKLEPTGPSSAQVTPKLGPSRLPFAPTLGQERPSLTPVGFWLGQVGPLLSSLSYSLGVGLHVWHRLDDTNCPANVPPCACHLAGSKQRLHPADRFQNSE